MYYLWYTGASWDIFSSESTMFTSLHPMRLMWSAGAAVWSSPNRVSAPQSRNVTFRTPAKFVVILAPGPKMNPRTVILTGWSSARIS